MRRIAILVLALSASLARAEDDGGGRELGPPDGYVASGAITGVDHYTFEGFTLEGGRRIHHSLFGRVMGAAGNTKLANDPGRGTYVEGRVGIEARTCTPNGMFCGSLGVDLGLHHGTYEHVGLMALRKPTGMMPSLEETFDSRMAVPRLTIDGGDRVRVRGVLELPNHLRETGSVTGVAVSLALGVAF